MKTTAANFKLAADNLCSDYRAATKNAKQSIGEMQSAIEFGTGAARTAAYNLDDAFETEHRWMYWALAALIFIIGVGVGLFVSRQLV